MHCVKRCVIKLCGCAGAQENAQVYKNGARALARAVGVKMKYSEEEKAMWLEDWRQSGKSVWAYAKANGLNPQKVMQQCQSPIS